METNPRRTAALMVAAAVLLNVAFTGLGAVFDYPDVLKHPAADVLADFRAAQFTVVSWFLVLALGAAMLVPVAIGETGGYLLTAAWTGLVLGALGTAFAGRLFVALGAASAVLILAGVLSPLDLPMIDLANFAGYVLWSIWLVAFAAVVVLRRVPVGSVAR